MWISARLARGARQTRVRFCQRKKSRGDFSQPENRKRQNGRLANSYHAPDFGFGVLRCPRRAGSAPVRAIAAGAGRIRPTSGALRFGPAPNDRVLIPTDRNGRASCQVADGADVERACPVRLSTGGWCKEKLARSGGTPDADSVTSQALVALEPGVIIQPPP